MAIELDSYKHAAAKIDDRDVDYGGFRDRPLSPEALRCLRYMCDIESHTVCYPRDLLVTPSHADPRVTTFLTMWAYEEYLHGEVLAKVLDAPDIPTGNAHIAAVRAGLGWRDRWAPIQQALAANLIGVDFVAVHMAWGAVNEWSTHAGYSRLAEREQHPILTDVLGRLMRQETRHIALYATQARDRLLRSARARRLTRFALRRFWAPVGSGMMPRAETTHLVGYLLGGPAGATVIDQLDERIHRLPGLDGLGLVGGSSGSPVRSGPRRGSSSG
ncbi:hypothetical protein DKT68_19475 [Micromonospora acroterricola]|uniref:Ferritin-like domain-containing protein n=1 Tax=Micromonospora acroterricola TaxID=2202421 RepID=A0A317D0C7_9ACTN|nr:hypothetical protein [Micromonospora acroterricola]PWR07256.1 hypothetical protein DKT68_19475 [Micromonospora acroterricola]